jgi:hypothetical protein
MTRTVDDKQCQGNIPSRHVQVIADDSKLISTDSAAHYAALPGFACWRRMAKPSLNKLAIPANASLFSSRPLIKVLGCCGEVLASSKFSGGKDTRG